MKYLIIISLMFAFGCGMLGGKSETERKEDPVRPPAPHEIIKNADGTYTVIIDESLNVKPEKEGVSFTKWFCVLGFLGATALGARSLYKDIYEKELKKGYDK
tara:strand:+ start:910 stop:1215 length:306 start_codon:yes stop_codon:yes gene_type:complete